MTLLGRFAVLLGLLSVGVLARRAGLLGPDNRARLNAVAFYVVLPALVFDSTYDRALSDLLSPAIVAGLVLVIATTVAIAWLLLRRVGSTARRSTAVVQSYHGNLGYLGLPIVATTLGSVAAGTASVILGFALLVQIPITVFVLSAGSDADVALLAELRTVLTNPVILGLVAGLAVAASGRAIPEVAADGVGAISTTALPVALLLVGSALEFERPTGGSRALASVVGLKVLLMPAVAWIIYSGLGVEGLALQAAVVMFGAPTAISTYIYAGELGGDTRFASLAIFVTTLASLGAWFGVLWLF